MGGAGKSTLLRHLMEWWQTTGLVEQVVYCGYDERAWSLEQVLDEIGRALYTDNFHRERLPDPRLWQAKVTRALRSQRHLLVLDNLESITGAALAIRHLLDAGEQAKLGGFIAGLAGGRSLVLLGSRGPETWLTGPAVAWRYELPGLDPEAATALAERILERYAIAHLRSDPAHSADLRHLLALLDGHPLALEVVLANLRSQTPGQVVEALQAGDSALDAEVGMRNAELEETPDPRSPIPSPLFAEKTSSILRCIEYSHSNLSPEAQALLACLAPFTGAVFVAMLEAYSEKLREEAALAHLPYERWPEVLQEAVNWGLLTPFDMAGNQYLRIQPIFPYFLRNRLNHPTPTLPILGREQNPTPALPILGREQIEGSAEKSSSFARTALPPEWGELEGGGMRQSIERAFHRFYDDLGGVLAGLIKSKEAPQRRLGQALIGIEYENLMTAVRLALAGRERFYSAFDSIFLLLDGQSALQQAAALCSLVLAAQTNYNQEQMDGHIGIEFYLIFESLAYSNLKIKQYGAAQKAYEGGLALIQQLGGISAETRGKYSATVYHQLGMVAQEQRRWEEAESHYRQALALYVEFNDRYEQAGTYHQLGRVAEEQRRWEEAESHYRQALALYVEFNDRYEQAGTYHQLGMVAAEQRRWEEAESHYRQALALNVEFDDRYSQASTYHQLGMVAAEQRRWEEAESHYRQALALKVEFNDRYSQASTYGQLGNLMVEQRRWEEAESHYRQALALFVEFNDGYSQAGTYHQLGRVAEEQRRWEEAESHYRQALALFVEFNDGYGQARLHHSLGIVSAEQRRWEEAESHYRQALALKVEFNDRYSQASTYHQLGRLAEEQQKWEKAVEYLWQDLTISLEFNDQYGAGITLRSLGRVHQASGDGTIAGRVAGLLGVSAVEAARLLGGDRE